MRQVSLSASKTRPLLQEHFEKGIFSDVIHLDLSMFLTQDILVLRKFNSFNSIFFREPSGTA